MSETSARYEFRAFADDFGLVEEARLRDRESLEVYIMSAGTDEYNIKIRGALMDLQAFVNYDPGLEQWSPLLKGEFPLTRQVILDKVFPAFGVAHPS